MELTIKLNFITDINAFVGACTTVFEEEIYVKQGRQIINAKKSFGNVQLRLEQACNSGNCN